MRNKFFAAIIISLTLIIFTNVNLTAVSGCSPIVTLLNQDPNPGIPGGYIKVIFEVTGMQEPDCNGMTVKLVPEYPFSLDPNATAIQTIVGNTYVSNYKSTWNIPYKVRVAEDALEGDYSLRLLYNLGSNSNLSSTYVDQGFNITINDVQTNFDAVLQEVSGTQVSIGIINTGKNTANSLVVKIPLQDNFRTTGTSEQIVGNLASGDYTILSFNIASKISRNMTRAEGQQNLEQQLKVQLDYTDGIGNRRSVVKEISLGSLLSQQGNMTAIKRSNQTSSINYNQYIYYIIGAVIIIVAGIIIYKKYNKKIREEKTDKKTSKNVPDWVLSERTRRKK